MNVIWFSKKGMPIVKEAVNGQLQTSWNTYTEHLFVVVVFWNRWNLWIFNKFQIFDILKFFWIIPSKRLEAFKNVYFACNVITHVYLLTFIHFIRQISWHVSRTYRQTDWLADWHEHTPLLKCTCFTNLKISNDIFGVCQKEYFKKLKQNNFGGEILWETKWNLLLPKNFC